MATSKQPSILIAASTWWPLTARLAVSLLEHGCRVSALCPKGHPLRAVRGIYAVPLYGSWRPMQALRRAILAANPDIIVPGDDSVVWQLHCAHQQYPELRPVIERSLGDPKFYGEIRSRDGLARAAEKLGIRTPANAAITAMADLEAWLAENSFPAVMKVDGSYSGSGVEVVRSHQECLPVYRHFQRRSGMGAALKRWMVNRNPLALWSWRQRQPSAISVQKWIEGRPATAMFAAWQGKMVGSVVVEVLATQGSKGAATVVRPIVQREIAEAGRLLAGHLRISGFFGLDFILEESSGLPYLLELNPRCTQLGHLSVQGKMDLAGLMTARLVGEPPPPATEVLPEGPVAFFPQVLDGKSGTDDLISRSYLDVPVGQPELVKELRRKAWPERQWISRIYHPLFHEPSRS